MVIRVAPERRRVPAPDAPLLRRLLSALGFPAFATFGPLGTTQVGGDRLRLGAAAARTTATALVAVTRGLGATLAAVRHRALGALFRLLARRSGEACLGDRVG